MSSKSQRVLVHLPYLRRYARALTGSQADGDAWVGRALTALLEQPEQFDAEDDRLTLFRVFHGVFDGASGAQNAAGVQAHSAAQAAADDRLSQIASPARRMILLTAMEGFDIEDAAGILSVSFEEALRLLDQGREEIAQQMKTRVMIIEDEPIIALDIQALAEELGHEVIGVAATRDNAVELARETEPALVLADIQLADGSSGVDAVNDIIRTLEVPIIFITAYPEKLLTGDRPEPAFLITKPFSREAVKATISQALFFKKIARAAA